MTANKQARRRAKRHAEFVFRRDGGRCVYCGCWVMPIGKLDPEQIIRVTAHWVWFWSRDRVEHMRLASIDHVIESDAGGDSRPDNLALACVSCNGKKNREYDRRLNLARKKVLA